MVRSDIPLVPLLAFVLGLASLLVSTYAAPPTDLSGRDVSTDLSEQQVVPTDLSERDVPGGMPVAGRAAKPNPATPPIVVVTAPNDGPRQNDGCALMELTVIQGNFGCGSNKYCICQPGVFKFNQNSQFGCDPPGPAIATILENDGATIQNLVKTIKGQCKISF